MFCQECEKRETCTKICKELNNYLEKSPDGYTNRWIRKKEIPYADIDEVAQHRALYLKYGIKKD